MVKTIDRFNNVLRLKGSYAEKSNNSRGGGSNLPIGKEVNIQEIIDVKTELERVYNFWKNINEIEGLLINVLYKRVIPKTLRIQYLLYQSGVDTNSTIVGATFKDNCHCITHYIKNRYSLIESANYLEKVYKFSKEHFGDVISYKDFNIDPHKKEQHKINYKTIGKTKYRKLIVEISEIADLKVPKFDRQVSTNSILSFYETDKTGFEVLSSLNLVNNKFVNKIDKKGNVVQVDKESYKAIISRIPYLIANSGPDLLNISSDDPLFLCQDNFSALVPNNEPVIGVLDTGYVPGSYFDKMVDYDGTYLGHEYDSRKNGDYHGTRIDSILVDGDNINSDRYNDGCGRFRVKHFGICRKSGEPSTTIIKRIREIVSNNRNIHVWNISIGSDLQIDDSYISFEAAALDELQYEYKDIVFIIAGTNMPQKNIGKFGKYKIGAPADSINSIVVNSVTYDDKIPDYAREGGVLYFFNKPDISCFGGNNEKGIRVCDSCGQFFVAGTSYAAPWISRKMCFLIDKMNLSRETAKALLIDSAAKWNFDRENKYFKGYGVVPCNIKDILKTRSDEIRFILTGVSKSYMTYNYDIPIPMANNHYPFIARATLCYFPSCTRNQGVDYTDTELSIKFGRISGNKIIDINNNTQDDSGSKTTEDAAREYQRKWDNVKFISSELKANNKSLKSYENKMWGISIYSKQRTSKVIPPLNFSVAITLREINGVNRIDSFIQSCKIKGWTIETIDIDLNNKIYNEAQNEIKFDE